MTFPAYPDKMEATKKGACMDMGSRRMQIVGIVLAVLMAAGGIVCWGYGRGLEIEQAEKAQLRRYCRKLKSCQRAAEEKNDRHSA